MTTGLSYDGSVPGTMSYLSQLGLLAVAVSTDTNFLAAVPATLAYAENRIYRDLDFLSTTGSATYAATANLRSVAVPTSAFVTVQQVNVISPAGQSNPELGTRNPLQFVTKEFLDNVWPSSSGAALPTYAAMFGQNTILLGPWPNAGYTMEVVGTVRPDSLSATNQTTFVSLYLPDLLLLASMVYVSALQRNWGGATANDPQMPVNYEMQYQTLKAGAAMEEARKKFQSSAWASMSPSVAATPGRGA